MAIIKCKMCGGDLNIIEGASVAECEYCGTRQTVPSADNEKKLTLFARAGRLLRACEFDKAAGIFESLVAEFPEEAEAYWGLVLCKYGVEYVDDPATGRKIPTCHRSSFDSVMDDENFEQARENADAVAKKVYRDEAKVIEELRKGIIEVSGREEPYDIFICYKETDEKGGRTLDSVLAQDVYDALTEKGYRVFFSRITLEDKLGQEYEPYIFAALNSAKVMLAFGTDYEHYDAVWVKNEWSRFLKLIASGEKKTLIPCYKGIDAYDLPKEFAKLQAQDMGKVGATQDLLRGIDKLLGSEKKEAKETVIVQQVMSGPGAESLCERGELFLEDKDWQKADEYFDKALDIDPKCAQAYLGKLLVKLKLRKPEDLASTIRTYDNDPLYRKAMRFSSEEFQARLTAWAEDARTYKEKERNRLNALCNESAAKLAQVREHIAPAAECIAINTRGVFGLKADGTVVASHANRAAQDADVTNWNDIVAIDASDRLVLGVRSDGEVVFSGENHDGLCNAYGWKDIISVKTSGNHTVGLRKDGTVVAVGKNDKGQCNVSDWRDIVQIAASKSHTVGLKADGTIVETEAHSRLRSNRFISVSARYSVTIALKDYGSIESSEMTKTMPDLFSTAQNIVAIASGAQHTVVLKADGTVLAYGGKNQYGECDVSDWTDIVAINADTFRTVGLKADGTVVVAGAEALREAVSGWRLFNSIDTLEQERADAREAVNRAIAEQAEREAAKRAKEKWEREQRSRAELAELEKRKANLQAELGSLKGLFANSRRKKLEEQLEQIELMIRTEKAFMKIH